MWILIGLAGIYLLLLIDWRLGENLPNTFGSAHWCRVWTLFKIRAFKRKGLILGDWTGLLPVHYSSTHAITFGSTGAGKGTTAVLPNLLNQRHVFLLDPGGENSAVASKYWRESGLEFSCINFFGMHTEEPWALPEHGFNPLDLLEPSSSSFAADALVIAEMLIKRSGGESESASFFKNTARGHLRDFIIHCKSAEPPQRQNLATIFEYMNSDAEDWEKLLAAMKNNAACGYLARTGAIALERREAQAPEEFSAVLSTMQEDLNWLTDPRVRTFLSRSDTDFTILKNPRGGIISVVLPLQYNKSHAAISRLALACAVLTMQRSPLSENKVLCLIDEAADLGKLAHLPDWLATLRKYNVALWPIFQNIGQLVDLYGRGWQTLTANCGMLQLLGIGNDLETAEHTERLLGKCTVLSVSINGKGERSFGETARPLITADELRRTGSNWQIVLMGNLPAVPLRKTPYWERPELTGRYHPNPYVGELQVPSGKAKLKALWGKLYFVHVWLLAPHPVAAAIITLVSICGVLLQLDLATLAGLVR